MNEQDKIKIKEILDSIKAIPKEENMEQETDNLFPLLYEMKKIQDKYAKMGKEEWEIYRDETIKILETELANRILIAITYNQDKKWKEYKECQNGRTR